MPQAAAGILEDPPPSVLTASGPTPVAAATQAPPLLPPGERCVSQGLRVMPVSSESVSTLAANSGVVVLPIKMAPAARNRETATTSLSGW